MWTGSDNWWTWDKSFKQSRGYWRWKLPIYTLHLWKRNKQNCQQKTYVVKENMIKCHYSFLLAALQAVDISLEARVIVLENFISQNGRLSSFHGKVYFKLLPSKILFLVIWDKTLSNDLVSDSFSLFNTKSTTLEALIICPTTVWNMLFSCVSETIAFSATLTTTSAICPETNVLFNDIDVNERNGCVLFCCSCCHCIFSAAAKNFCCPFMHF